LHSVAAMAVFKPCGSLFVGWLVVVAVTQCTASSILSLEISTLHKENGELWVNSVLEFLKLLVRVEEFLPSPLHLEYHDPDLLKDGDILVIHSLWMWKTYAIVSSAKEKKVICFATCNRRPVSDMGALFSKTDVHLQEVGLDEVLATDHGVVEVIVQENQAKTLQNARAALAHGHPWQLFGFNSEHFVTHAATGKAQSPQLDNLLSVGKKVILSGIMAAVVIPESCTILRKCAKSVAETTTNKVISSSPQAVASQIAKETTKKAANKVASSSTQAAASQAAKEAANKTASKVAGSSTQAAAPQVAKHAAKKTANKVASGSTKAAASQVAKQTAKEATEELAHLTEGTSGLSGTFFTK